MELIKKETDRIREVLSILMESPLYFDMPLIERYELVIATLKKL